MSTYEYTSTNGRRSLMVESAATEPDSVFVSAGHKSYPMSGIWISNADVPTVATELLKAAGRADLAEYIEAAIEKEAESARIAEAVNPEGLTRCKLCNEGIAQAKAAREAAEKAEAEAAKKKLQERRDAVAASLGMPPYSRITRHLHAAAIDRIIELEDGASRD